MLRSCAAAVELMKRRRSRVLAVPTGELMMMLRRSWLVMKE